MPDLPQSVIAADICESWAKEYSSQPGYEWRLVAFWELMAKKFREGGRIRSGEYRELKGHLAAMLILAESPLSFQSTEFRKVVLQGAKEAQEIIFIINEQNRG